MLQGWVGGHLLEVICTLRAGTRADSLMWLCVTVVVTVVDVTS